MNFDKLKFALPEVKVLGHFKQSNEFVQNQKGKKKYGIYPSRIS